MTSKQKAAQLLAKAGIEINGKNPWDIQVRDERFYDRVFSSGTLAVGESYMDGWWNVEDLPTFFNKVISARLDKELRNIGTLWYFIKAWVLNMQNKDRALEVAHKHYDVGNDLYERMLGRTMTYTCGYWSPSDASGPTARDLDEAQEHKLDLVCRKLNFKAGQTVLDIGCGWGSFAKFAAEKYGVKMIGITISKEQAELAREVCKGLPVEIKLEDYRDTTGQFDHIVSLGMFEHVGPKNYRTYMEKVHALLKDDGLFLLHTIGTTKSVIAVDPWIDKYIFPGGVLPSVAYIGKAIDDLLILEDWHSFGPDYEKTLLAWCMNFEKGWPGIQDKYSERFYRMWRFYLHISAATFRMRDNQLWQIVLSKKGIMGGYRSVR
ncbi:MAG: cyclopropane fatty acyl phospholipid synthase [bacterium]|nr:cyclopropane fatty acyl phospholipid synthase [bacterium]